MRIKEACRWIVAGLYVGGLFAVVTLANGCGEPADGEPQGVYAEHSVGLSSDGTGMLCNHGEPADETDKGLVSIGVKTGGSDIFTERYIPDSKVVRWRFTSTCAEYPQFKAMARWGIQDFFAQSWAPGPTFLFPSWFQEETSAPVDVTINCVEPSLCSHAGNCASFAATRLDGTRRLAGTVDGISYFTMSSGTINADVVMMDNWVDDACDAGGCAPGYDVPWVQSNAYYFVMQHEMHHWLEPE